MRRSRWRSTIRLLVIAAVLGSLLTILGAGPIPHDVTQEQRTAFMDMAQVRSDDGLVFEHVRQVNQKVIAGHGKRFGNGKPNSPARHVRKPVAPKAPGDGFTDQDTVRRGNRIGRHLLSNALFIWPGKAYWPLHRMHSC